MFFVAGGNAAHSDKEHNATLSNLANIFRDVVTTEELVGMIGAAAPRAAAE